MKNDDLERALFRGLSEDQEIVPSSSFTFAVIDAVRRDAAAPSPLALPWKFAVPGLAALTFIAAAILFFVFTELPSTPPMSLSSEYARILSKVQSTEAEAMILVGVVTLASLLLSFRLAASR